MVVRRLNTVSVLAAVLAAATCGDTPRTPTAPTPVVVTRTTLAIEGPDTLEVRQTVEYLAMVTYSDGATRRVTEGVEWTSGNTVVATVDGDGRVTGHQVGTFDLTARAEGLTGRRSGIRVEPPPPPATSFESGTWIVNEDIASGRYFTDPAPGCYWERLRGLGGTVVDVLANRFIDFDAAQEIVDVDDGDRAFFSDPQCRSWDMKPRPGPPSGTITPGRWLIGAQVEPGEYQADAAQGCYWERLRRFTGTTDSIRANDFLEDSRRVTVAIAPSDVGFHADPDCGRWTRRGSSSSTVSSVTTDPRQIEQNRVRNRATTAR